MQVREGGTGSLSTSSGIQLVQRIVGLTRGGEKTSGGVLPRLGRLVRRDRRCDSQFRAQASYMIADTIQMIGAERV